MSLIQEALKRQQEDSDRKGTMTPAAAVASPPVVSEPAAERASVRRSPGASQTSEPQPVKEEKAPPLPPVISTPDRRLNWSALIAIVVLVLFILGGGIWLSFSILHSKAITNRPATKPLVTALPVPMPSHPSGTVTVLAVASPIKIASTSTVPAVVSASSSNSTPPTVTPPPALPIPSPSVTTGTTVNTPSNPVAIPPQDLPVVWPSLALSGVMGRGPQGSARINKTIVAVSDSILGVTVVSIGNQGVELEYKGERRLLKVGSSTQ